MKRSSRKSTQEKSRELAVKLEQRQLKSLERKARLEKKKVDKASREEAHELAEVVPKASGSVPPVGVLETVLSAVVSAEESTKESSASEEEEDYWYDTSVEKLSFEDENLEQSFIVSPATPLSVSELSSDNWSTVNKFFPEGAEKSPPPASAAFDFCQSVLKSIIEETGTSEGEHSIEGESQEEIISKEKMDPQALEVKMKELRRVTAKIEVYLKRDNATNVTLQNFPNYEARLENIFSMVVDMKETVQDILEQLHPETQREEIDKDDTIMKCLSEGEIELFSNDGVIAKKHSCYAKKRGIIFKTCSAQGHNAHGRVERKIQMIQEAFDRSDLRKFKLHGLGWQTVAKSVESQVNSIAL